MCMHNNANNNDRVVNYRHVDTAAVNCILCMPGLH